MVELNGKIYSRCPRAMVLQDPIGRNLVNVYFQCKDVKCLPFPGSMLQQTQFTSNLFDFILEYTQEQKSKKASVAAEIKK